MGDSNVRITLNDGSLRYQSGEDSWAWPAYMAAPLQNAFLDAVLPTLSAMSEDVRFDDRDCLVLIDGAPYPPTADVSALSQDAQAFHAALYGYSSGYYADQYALLKAQAPIAQQHPLTPEQAKARQTALIELDFANEVAAIKAGYPADEILSWDQQVLEAKAYQADAGAATPLLDAMVSTRGGTKADLVTRILANDAAYRQAFGQALGRMQKRKIDLG